MTVMPVPVVDLAEMEAARLRLGQVVLMAGRAESALDASALDTSALAGSALAASGSSAAVGSSWTGRAADAYFGARGRLSRRVGSVVSAAGAAAAAIASFEDRSGRALAGMRAAGRELEQALDARARLAGTVPVEPGWVAERVDAAWRRYERCSGDYDEAVQVATVQLEAAAALVQDVPLDVGDQVAGGVSRFWTDAVADPARGAWGMTGGFFTDRKQWKADVTALPGQYWQMLTNPRETAGVMVGEQEWRAGQWGAGAGAIAANVVPTHKLKAALSPDAAPASMRNRADPNAPRPRLQSLDELFERVDLRRHEHHAYGHAIRRHVDVDDTYLQERLVLGTLKDDGSRKVPPPRNASAFTDLDTAELAITEVLRLNQEDVREWAAGTKNRKPLGHVFDEPIGRVMSKAAAGEFVVREGSAVMLWLKRENGQIFIETAYVD